jgi:hypothetical protein
MISDCIDALHGRLEGDLSIFCQACVFVFPCDVHVADHEGTVSRYLVLRRECVEGIGALQRFVEW